MALTATDTVTYRAAAATAAAIHMHYEGEVVETPLSSFTGEPSLHGVAVLAPQRGIVEVFPADDQPLGVLRPSANSIVAQGWQVGVVVPSHRLGDAHHHLRGTPVHLQAWWYEEDRICFGGPEVP